MFQLRCWRAWPRLTLCGAAGLLLALALRPNAEAQQPPAQAQSLDQALSWLYEGRKFHAGLRDYSCYLIKQERVRGVLLPEHVMQFMFRPQPFSVYMRWMSPAELKGQEVAYVHGYNSNKMKVHPKVKGFAGKIVGFVSIDPGDPRVFEHSRHNIYEAGLGSSIEQLIKHFEMEKPLNKTSVSIAEYAYNNRKCNRVEVARTERHKDFYCYRSVVYIDQEHKLPIRIENYEWPTQGGQAGGELMESFSYINLEFNKNIPDSQFKK